MKRIILMMGFIFCAAAICQAQVVGTDRELNSNLKNFKTYAWTDKIDKIPGDAIVVGGSGVVVFNNESTRANIKEAISYELNARGYEQATGNPDFLVTFQVLDQPTELIVYNGYRTLHGGFDTVRTKENVGSEQVQAGTVMINFVDFKTGQNVWQGFASGILKPDMINDQAKVRSAINSIFSEYQYQAFKDKDN